jgi:hypothetical protein
MNIKNKKAQVEKHFDSCFNLMNQFYRTKKVKITSVDGISVAGNAYLKKNKARGFILTGDRDFKTQLFFSDKIHYRHTLASCYNVKRFN